MTTSELPLENKVALVTGASSGIGRAIAVGWARAGARVACAARSASGLAETVAAIEAAGRDGLAVRADVTRHADVERMYEETASAFGGIDIVMINAGGNHERNRIGEDDPEGWLATVQLNLAGAYYTAREAIPHLKARGGGRMLLMGSGMGHRALAGASAYCVAKAGSLDADEGACRRAGRARHHGQRDHPGPGLDAGDDPGARDERLAGGVDSE